MSLLLLIYNGGKYVELKKFLQINMKLSPQKKAVYFAGTIPLFIGNWSDEFCAFL